MMMEKDIKYALSIVCQKSGRFLSVTDTITSIDVNAWVALMITISETLKNTVDLLRLFRQLDLHEQFAYGHINRITEESELAHVASQYRKQKGVISFAKVAGNDAFVKIVCFDSFQVSSWRLSLFAFR
jgi:hypothetical protein